MTISDIGWVHQAAHTVWIPIKVILKIIANLIVIYLGCLVINFFHIHWWEKRKRNKRKIKL